MRRVEQAVDEAVLDRRGIVAQHAGDEPHHRIHQGHRRQLAAGQHEVAEGDFLVDAAVQQALVHRLVAAAQDDETGLVLQCHHAFVGQRLALRRHEDHTGRRQAHVDLPLLGRIDRGFERLRQHHHAGSAAIGAVIHGAVTVLGEIARIPDLQGPALLLEGAAGDSRLRQCGEHFWEQAHDVKLHRISLRLDEA